MKIFKTIVLILLLLFFASWFYKTIVLLLLAKVWKKELCAKKVWGYWVTIGILSVALFCFLPRYRYNTSDRVQLIYQDKDCQPECPPLSHYLVNVLLPEEEICNIGIWCARLVPKSTPLSGWILDEFRHDDKLGKVGNFYRPFERLNRSGNFIMSGTTSQVFNTIGWGKTQSVYLIKPKKINKDKKYPVVFFMHGYLGNWKLYNGILKDLDDCIVLGVGTKDLSGIYTKRDIETLFTKQIPFLENMGYKVDKDNIHLIGLSNGGSASNVAYNNFSKRFKSITFVSTGIHQTYPISSKVLLIGGGKDHSSGSLPGAYRKLKENGTQTDLFWEKDETHFILVNKREEIINFLNKNIL